MPKTVDITVIGAGVVGLAIASELAGAGREVYILEKNETFGLEQSSRSSEVIHSGVLTGKGTLRADLSLEGARLLYEICEKYGVPYRRCGKLFIATNSDETEVLERMYQRAKDCGIECKMLSQREQKEIEPNLTAAAAFHTPSSGTVDAYELMRFLLSKARGDGAHIFYRSEVTGIEKEREGYTIRVNGNSNETTLSTRLIVNCAGLFADRISELAGIDIDKAEYGIRWGKGEFYAIGPGTKGMLNSLIYPVPSGIGPGIHTCMDVDGVLRLGPLFYFVDEIDYRIDDTRRAEFEESSIMQALPFIDPSDLEPESTGIMVYSQEGISRTPDYIIKEELEFGLPGYINLVGMSSPALTASPAIGRYVNRIVKDIS